jgi:hypothetical protein
MLPAPVLRRFNQEVLLATAILFWAAKTRWRRVAACRKGLDPVARIVERTSSTDRRFEWREIRIVKHQGALSTISNERMNFVFAMIKLICVAMAFDFVLRPHSSDLVWQ